MKFFVVPPAWSNSNFLPFISIACSSFCVLRFCAFPRPNFFGFWGFSCDGRMVHISFSYVLPCVLRLSAFFCVFLTLLDCGPTFWVSWGFAGQIRMFPICFPYFCCMFFYSLL
ncbi:hypothetical protein AAZX31_12G162900 [Glycine max]|uniref:Uncharacterized protein n=1 Tax=Glycine max TaxID=3847 RepID=A0A0R0HGE7_SOYBN|nr:hypothetical protein JHK85_034902 [Glycine max]KAG4986565.1 hypothetical protein JHK86_034256 [Glycine max]KAG5119769.1 hypothetical protein JHK82_034189 [Glycine max]KAG5140760.1 hypothetical protein JHK84_034528 [Glycine max]KAH1143617.1 hypothetical protein GYH30_034053 [Glycine max]